MLRCGFIICRRRFYNHHIIWTAHHARPATDREFYVPAFASVLTYHSQNINFPRPGHNDHLALAADLEALHEAGFRLLPLARLADVLDGNAAPEDLQRAVFLTFDDGCDMDFRDVDYPDAGPQRGFLGILQDFISRHGADAQPGLHASSFVIASPRARAAIDSGSLFGRGWISDDWWRDANQGGLLAIENHGWDHFHPDARPQAEAQPDTATTTAECALQVLKSGRVHRTPEWPPAAVFRLPVRPYGHPVAGQLAARAPASARPARRFRHRARLCHRRQPALDPAALGLRT